MTVPVHPSTPPSLGVLPMHVLAGLGSADRHLLAVCLALFEDSALLRRLEQVYEDVSRWMHSLTRNEVEKNAAGVKTRMSFWYDSGLSDNELRLILWIYVREAFGLPARLTVSTRGAEAIAAELAATAIHVGDVLKKRGERQHVTLGDLVSSVMQELMTAAFENGGGEVDSDSKKKLISETRNRLQGMGEADLRRLLEAVGAKELNDDAIRKILLAGGGLTAFSAGVGMAGFSAYVLAAQASAFIPLVSGPALVSAVAVVSNPITVIAATGGVIWWAVASARTKSQLAVGLRVVALLALQGLLDASNGLANAIKSFAEARTLRPYGDLDSTVVSRYESEWKLLEPALLNKATRPSQEVLGLMNRQVLDATNNLGAKRVRLSRGEAEDAAMLAALTLGDILYNVAAIDPAVIEASNFSRQADIGGPLDLATVAQEIIELSPKGSAGATNNLKGYVAERLVASELLAQGHDVAFPNAPNEPGWDILVDGHKFQVKWHDEIGGISEHFSKYEFPVLANSEMAENIPPEWADRVFFVQGYSNELVSHVTERSVEAGADAMHPDIPIYALTISAARNLKAYQAGSVSGVQAAEQVVVDGGTRAGLAVMGGYAGKAIGLLIFGPAGGLVLGTVLPILSQSQASNVSKRLDEYIKTDTYNQWAASTHDALDALVGRLRAELEEKLKRLRSKYRAFKPGGVRDFIRARIEDEATFLGESLARLHALGRTPECASEERFLKVLRWVASSTIHPVAYQSEMEEVRKVLAARPSLGNRVGELAGDVWRRVKEASTDIAGWMESTKTVKRKRTTNRKKKNK